MLFPSSSCHTPVNVYGRLSLLECFSSPHTYSYLLGGFAALIRMQVSLQQIFGGGYLA